MVISHRTKVLRLVGGTNVQPCTKSAALKGVDGPRSTLGTGQADPRSVGAARDPEMAVPPPKAKTAWLTPKDRYPRRA